MKTHEVADLFPLLSDAELGDLADDIKARGLDQPIVMQGDTLLDGRNRLAACKLAGVKPEFRQYAKQDVAEFIVAANVKRRHLTREQRGSVIKGLRERGMTLQKIAKAVGVSDETVRRATASTNVEGEVKGTDGKTYPTHYAPREDKPHVAHNSGDNEWYTPKAIVEAARAVMGKIELDPATTEEANKVIKADRIHTQQDNGLKEPWIGRCWLNPPFETALIGKFIDKLAASVESGAVTEALVLVNNATETKWFARLTSVSSFLCFPTGRVKFWHLSRASATPLQGQCVAYIGKHGKRFCEEFKAFGLVVEIVR